MNDIFNKLSSYNILNYLIPGAVFSVIAERLSLLTPPNEIMEQLVWFYFLGMVISRLGSTIVEPILKCLGFVVYSNYFDYLAACKADEKMEVMVETSNTYRTIATVFISLLALIFLDSTSERIGFNSALQGEIAIGLLSILFILSFRKQVKFVANRVNHHKKESE
ncbi:MULTISPECIES: hypothetical protein [Salipiger]|jgi:hypothetical protein|uniref:hypothetical protein n=1 Tax=Salipiger TaxID=263377 RepID=UPI0008E35D5E|nr:MULTISPECIES: hypothetical protein [Salipiger]GGA14064.1 hypothetical protein GCM10011326_27810 [Salipiger profundus]SFD50534.1 hypothetical protein SAMN05444415_111187 [Salipiger profundus]